jgi:hypothetical protein
MAKDRIDASIDLVLGPIEDAPERSARGIVIRGALAALRIAQGAVDRVLEKSAGADRRSE